MSNNTLIVVSSQVSVGLSAGSYSVCVSFVAAASNTTFVSVWSGLLLVCQVSARFHL